MIQFSACRAMIRRNATISIALIWMLWSIGSVSAGEPRHREKIVVTELPSSQSASARAPDRVEIPANHTLDVVLDTPLSSRIATKGEFVTFHIADFMQLSNDLALMPDTQVRGTVTDVKTAGHPDKPGWVRVRIDSVHLATGGSANLDAHLDAPKLVARGAIVVDKDRSVDLYGAMIDVARGATPGSPAPSTPAGSGGSVALPGSSPKRRQMGDDVFFEPGTRFSVILDQPAYLDASEVLIAEQTYFQVNGKPMELPGSMKVPGDDSGGMPKLKRRIPRN